MLNIMVINCDGLYEEYEWTSKEEFVKDIDSDNEAIPMLDDTLAEVNSSDQDIQLWWKESISDTVNDLYEECKKNISNIVPKI